MRLTKIRALAVTPLLALGIVAAGCGGSGTAGGSASVAGTTFGTTVSTTVSTNVGGANLTACRRLEQTTRQTLTALTNQVPKVTQVSSQKQLEQRLQTLSKDVQNASQNVSSVNTSGGKVQQDQQQIAKALNNLSNRISKARTHLKNNEVVAATHSLTRQNATSQIRSALNDLSTRCTGQ